MDIKRYDQFAYVTYAVGIAREGVGYEGGRNRMPLYPALMSLLWTKHVSARKFWERGKFAGIAITLGILAVCYVVFEKRTSRAIALMACAMAGFTAFAYKAPYFQADLLYYLFILLLFDVAIDLISRPTFPLTLLGALWAALAHLTKASVLPLVAAVAFFVFLAGLGTSGFRLILRSNVAQRTGYAVLFVGLYIVAIGPYLYGSKSRYGAFFYNVNSTFYLWCDSWEEAKSIRDAGDRDGRPDLPEADLPGPARYWRQHSLSQMAERLRAGAVTVLRTTLLSYGYLPFLGLYILGIGILLAETPECALKVWFCDRFWLFLFAATYFATYFVLYAWYAPISSGNRFVLSLFLPALLCSFRVRTSLKGLHQIRETAWCITSDDIHMKIIPYALLAYVVFIFPFQIISIPGGD